MYKNLFSFSYGIYHQIILDSVVNISVNTSRTRIETSTTIISRRVAYDFLTLWLQPGSDSIPRNKGKRHQGYNDSNRCV